MSLDEVLYAVYDEVKDGYNKPFDVLRNMILEVNGIDELEYYTKNVSFLKYFSIYTLADVRNVIQSIKIDPIMIIISLLITIIFISSTYIRYNSKELV